MKNILILFVFICVGLASHAQLLPFKKTGTTGTYSISFTNTAADTMDVNIGRIPALVTVRSTVTRATGTLAGKVYLYYATDVDKSFILCDSVTVTNAATFNVYFSKSIAAPYWRLIRNGATTVTGTLTAKVSSAQ